MYVHNNRILIIALLNYESCQIIMILQQVPCTVMSGFGGVAMRSSQGQEHHLLRSPPASPLDLLPEAPAAHGPPEDPAQTHTHQSSLVTM